MTESAPPSPIRHRSIKPVAAPLVLIWPYRAFEGVKERPRWWLWLTVLVFTSLAPAITYVATTNLERVVEQGMERSGRLEQIPEDARVDAVTKGAQAAKFALPAGAAAKRMFWLLICAGLGFALLRGPRPELRFAQALAAVAVGSLPFVLEDALETAVFLVRGTERIDARMALLSSPAALLDEELRKGPLGAFLGHFDLFRLWVVWLSGLGLKAASGSKGTLPWAAPAGLFLLGLVAATVGAFIGGAAAG